MDTERQQEVEIPDNERYSPFMADDPYSPYRAELDIEEWTSFRDELLSEGYGSGYGPRRGLALVDGQAIDRGVAEAAICAGCGGKCSYYAVHQVGPGWKEYRAFTVCIHCNKALEF
jgi:hypothetical protein